MLKGEDYASKKKKAKQEQIAHLLHEPKKCKKGLKNGKKIKVPSA